MLSNQKVLATLQEFLLENGFEGNLDFDRFTYYVESNDFEPINKSFIDQFVQYLISSNPGLSNKTIYNKISSLKSFFNFLDRVNMISHNPMAHYTNKYYERNININFLTEVECKDLLKALLEEPFSKYYYLLIWTAITTGLRNNEICCLSFEQINFQNNMVIVNKGQNKC